MSENRFRQLCRREDGGFETAKFAAALKTEGDPLVISFEVGLWEKKDVVLERAAVEQYARWAEEEAAPEKNLLESIKPEMRTWILNHRPRMCERLREALDKYNPEHGDGVQIIWPITTPDVVPYEKVKKYLEKYGRAQ